MRCELNYCRLPRPDATGIYAAALPLVLSVVCALGGTTLGQEANRAGAPCQDDVFDRDRDRTPSRHVFSRQRTSF